VNKLPFKSDIIYKGDPRIETFKRDAVISGDPDAVVRPRDWQEVKEIVKFCNGNMVPLTACGARTSMTGSSVAESGLLVTTDHFNRILDIGINNGRPFVTVEPGMIAADLQKAVEEKGFHYPVVPTSCDNAFVGGTVSTNATGEDFYKYGATRNFVREITIIKADGTEMTVSRELNDLPKKSKGLGGYYLDGSEIDKLIGSEGTLGIIKKITLDLLPSVPKTYIIMVPFRSNVEGLKFIELVNNGKKRPRSLEFIDRRSVALIKEHSKCPVIPPDIESFVYIKGELSSDSPENDIEDWGKIVPKTSLNNSIIATTDKQKNELHELRHYIPSRISELNEKYQKSGGGKISGDWWVPKKEMVKVMVEVYNEAVQFNDFFLYGHLGDGHPHTSYLCKNEREFSAAKDLVISQSRRAVSLGGGAAGEHGIGKIKHDLVRIQHNPDVIEQMRGLKLRYDPNWILGRGNILDYD